MRSGSIEAIALHASATTMQAAARIDEAREPLATAFHRPLARPVARASAVLPGELEAVVEDSHGAVGVVGLDQAGRLDLAGADRLDVDAIVG